MMAPARLGMAAEQPAPPLLARRAILLDPVGHVGGALPADLSKLLSPSLMELFDQSGDLTFAVLAIGRSPENPPEWALMACAIFYEQQQVAVPPPKTGRPPKYSVEDGLALDQVADLMVNEDLSVSAAVMQVTGEGTDGTYFRRLMRHWRRESKPSWLQLKDGKAAHKTNRWLRRAHKRKHDRFMEKVWAQARTEIAEGNLQVEEDPKVTAQREARAVWANFSSDVDPEQETRLKIAPLSEDLWVKEAKRWLLEHPEYLATADDPKE